MADQQKDEFADFEQQPAVAQQDEFADFEQQPAVAQQDEFAGFEQYPVAAVPTLPPEPTYGQLITSSATAIPRALTTLGLKAAGLPTGQSALEQYVKPVEDYEKAVEAARAAGQSPEGLSFGKQAAEFVGGFADPAGLLLGGTVGKVVGKVFAPAISRATEVGISQGTKPLTRALANKAAAEAATVGAITQGLTTGAKQAEEGKFDAAELATRVGLGGLVGGILGKGLGTLTNRGAGAKSMVARAAQEKLTKAQEAVAFSPDLDQAASRIAELSRVQNEVADLATKHGIDLQTYAPTLGERLQRAYGSDPKYSSAKFFTAQDAAKIKKIDGTFRRIDQMLAENRAKLDDPAVDSLTQWKAERAVARLETRQQSLREAFAKELEHPLYKALRENAESLGDLTTSVNGRQVPIFKTSLTKQGIFVPAEEINLLMNVDDLGRFESSSLSLVDMKRLTQQMDLFQVNGPVHELIFRPAEQALTKAGLRVKNMQNAFRTAVNNAEIDVGNKVQLKRLAAAMEGRLSETDAALVTPKEWEFVNYTKKLYQDLLNENNFIRRRLGYKEIAPRKDYMTHIQEWGLMDKLGAALDSGQDNSTAPKFVKKLRASFSFEKRRQGSAFIEDPVKAFEAYLEPAVRQIETMEPAALIQARAQYLPDRARNATRTWVQSALLGGADEKDQAIINTLGKAPLEVMAGVQSQLAKGAILGNLKVIAEQLSQIIPTARETGTLPMLRGLTQSWTGQEIPERIASKSNFVNLRNLGDDVLQFPNKWYNKPSTFMLYLLEVADRKMAKASWLAGLDKAQRLGLTEDAAVAYADEVGRMLHAQYKELYRPALIRGRSGRVLAPFQTFAFNSWNYLMRDQKVKAQLENTSTARQVVGALGAMIATNQVYEALGINGPFAFKIPQELSVAGFAEAGVETIKGQVPFLKAFTDQGTPSPLLNQIKSEVTGDQNAIFRNALVATFTDDDEKRDVAFDNLKKAGARFIPGGVQGYRFIKGVDEISKGYVTRKGQDIELTPQDKVHTLLFGSSNAPSVRKAREKEHLQKTKQFMGLSEDND
jgi:hypothetical protein